eukprot:CCRYP_008600-RA/>CCRYP_008600-RA protein AED:0.02 eAED:0.02 QI:750/1/1/1/0/0/2/213/616
MVKPISREMYPNPPHPAWSHSQPPPPPPPTMHSPHPSWQGHSTMYHYGPPHPPPPPTSAPPPHHPHHLRYPQPPSHHHRHAPRSRQPVYYHSRHPSPPPIATASRTIHPALVTPQTPQGPPAPPPPLPRAPSSSKAPATPSSMPVTHDPNARDPDMASSSNQHLITTKPPRPYTEYTMFYQLEREYILHRLLVDKNDPQAALDQEQQTQDALFKNDPLMPQRYRTLPLRADWYISGKSKKPSKRKHRKTHGKIGFLELTRMIAARWANVDDETRKYCKMMAAMELVKYKEDVESYNLYKARLEKMGEVPEDVKEKERKKRAKDKKAKEKSDALLVESAGAMTAGGGADAGGKARNVKADSVRSDEALSSLSSSSKQFRDESQDNVDNDMEQFITSLVHDDHPVQEDDQQRRDRKRSLSHLPPPLPPSNSTQLYREDHHTTSHYEAPWNHFMPGPREDRRGTMPMHPPPPVARAQDAASSSKIITPERSSKRRRLPVHRNAHNHGSTAAAYGVQSHPLEAAAMIHSGPVSPNEDELIHMTFSGIDESEIAREFYFPSHATESGDVAETTSPQEASVSEEASHPQTEALYGPPLQSFDYWDALMEPTTLQRGGGSERL